MNSSIGAVATAAVDSGLRSAARKAWARVVGRVASIADDETKASRRGFLIHRQDATERLETIGRCFAHAYNHAVRSYLLDDIETSLAKQPPENSGFAYEGAAMGIFVADWLTPGRRMFDAYLRGPARDHEYMAWVGIGWALARLPVTPMRVLSRYPGLNRWLALDGYGFHAGYFHWREFVQDHSSPRLTGDAGRVFDTGLGRSLWFSRGASPDSVAACIETFAMQRRGDLWAGAGLAAAYAGPTTPSALRRLREFAGVHVPALAQGVTFAAEARRRAGNFTEHMHIACRELTGLTSIEAANLTIAERPSHGDDLQAFQSWRLGIQRRIASSSQRLDK